MTDVTDSRSFIQVEEVDANSAISEGTLAKIAGAINHILHNASDFLGQVEESVWATTWAAAAMTARAWEAVWKAQAGAAWAAKAVDGND